MANSGWVAISRDIVSHWVWNGERFTRGQAWVHLIILATWKDHKEVYNGRIVKRKRGTVSCSMRWLADAWGWNVKTVSRFLKMLADDGMVEVESGPDGTTITIKNYAKWQPNMGTPKPQNVGIPSDTKEGTPNGTPKALELQAESGNGVTQSTTPNTTPSTTPNGTRSGHTIRKNNKGKNDNKGEEEKKRIQAMKKRLAEEARKDKKE